MESSKRIQAKFQEICPPLELFTRELESLETWYWVILYTRGTGCIKYRCFLKSYVILVNNLDILRWINYPFKTVYPSSNLIQEFFISSDLRIYIFLFLLLILINFNEGKTWGIRVKKIIAVHRCGVFVHGENSGAIVN